MFANYVVRELLMYIKIHVFNDKVIGFCIVVADRTQGMESMDLTCSVNIFDRGFNDTDFIEAAASNKKV